MGLVGAAGYLFFDTERMNQKLDADKLNAETIRENWEKEGTCVKNSVQCEAYSKQLEDWSVQFGQYVERKKQTPQFQVYFFLKEFDEESFPSLNYGGWTSIAVFSILTLLFALLILLISRNEKKVKLPVAKTLKVNVLEKRAESALKTTVRATKTPVKEIIAKPPASGPKPDVQALLRKALECAKSEPMQAISYLEQAIDGSLTVKLSLPSLLLCGSLRIKNKIDENRGKEQLQKIISSSPESAEAKKAKIVLDTSK
jgi:hypothetical protein